MDTSICRSRWYNITIFMLMIATRQVIAWRLHPGLVHSSSTTTPTILFTIRSMGRITICRQKLSPRRILSVVTATSENDLTKDYGNSVKEEARMGPGAPQDYWNNIENIKQELQVFFQIREAEERRLLEEKSSNPVRKYLGLSDEEQKRIRRRDALIDRDLYSDLRRYGFDYLILPIMEQGGFRVFAKIFSSGNDEPPREEISSGLTLGKALEEKLEALSDRVSSEPPSAATLSTTTTTTPSSLTATTGYMQDDETSLDPSRWKKAEVRDNAGSSMPENEKNWSATTSKIDLSLSNSMKLYSAILLLALAVGFGKSSDGAIARGFMTQTLLDQIQLAAEGGVIANIMTVPITSLLLLQAGVSMSKTLVLALKAMIGGPICLLEYRLNGDFDNKKK